MKFEKLSENKIKITFSMHDLEEKDIDFHDFMSNSLESQDLFLDLLEEAEKRIGFKTSNCKVKIEALAMTENDFVLTVTKVLPEHIKKLYASPKKKLVAKRKAYDLLSTYLIYKFNTFDDYCYFIEFLLHNNLADANKIAQKVFVYLYKNCYYLVFNNINTKYEKISRLYNAITEFGSYVANPDIFVNKLVEYGTLFIKNNAIKKSMNHYSA